jgi:hypothetical protein
VGLALALAALGAPARAAEDPARPRDGAALFSRLSQGQLVILARVAEASGKATLVREKTYRGPEAPAQVTLAYRGENFARDPGAPALHLSAGERAVFVLAPAGDAVHPGRPGVYRPVGGYAARVPLPPEGQEALLDAVARITAFQDADPGDDATATLTSWLGGPNPWLIDAALAQAATIGLVDREMAPLLLQRTLDASPGRRQRAAEALGVALERGRLTRRNAGDGALILGDEMVRAALDVLVRLARTDSDADVRRAAVRVLGHAPGEETRTVLKAISRDDPSQEVRYEAAAALAGGNVR